MPINLDAIINQMEANAAAIDALCRSVSDAQARWKPDAESWSLLEVICHLHDEEREDFRTRVNLTLHEPQTDWPPIDPQGWVKSRDYNSRNLAVMAQKWQEERAQSLDWLRHLHEPNWGISRPTPWGRTLSAGDVMASWLAHDHLHMRQLNELHYLWHRHISAPLNVEYAGEW